MYLIFLICLVIPFIFNYTHQIFKSTKLGLIIIASLFSSIVLTGLALIMINGNLIAVNESFGDIKSDRFLWYLLGYLFSINFLGIGLYLFLNKKFTNLSFQKYSFTWSNLILGLSIAFTFFFYKRSFTLTSFISLLVILLYIEYYSKLRYMFQAYRAYLLLAIAIIFINWILIQNNSFIKIEQTTSTGIKLFHTPIELIILLFSGFLININFIERLKTKKIKS